jgi:hypothetical protein
MEAERRHKIVGAFLAVWGVVLVVLQALQNAGTLP